MILITSMRTLVVILIQVAIAYFLFKITDRQNLYTIAGGTALVDVLMYLLSMVLGYSFLLNIIFYILSGVGLNYLYKRYGYGILNKKSVVIAVVNTIIMYFI